MIVIKNVIIEEVLNWYTFKFESTRSKAKVILDILTKNKENITKVNIVAVKRSIEKLVKLKKKISPVVELETWRKTVALNLLPEVDLPRQDPDGDNDNAGPTGSKRGRKEKRHSDNPEKKDSY